MRKIHVRMGGVGVAYEGIGLSGEVVFVATYPPLLLFQGETFGGTLGTSSIVSQWYDIPEGIAFPSNLEGYRGIIEVSGMLVYKSNVDIDFTLQVPNPDGSFSDGPKFKRNVSCKGWKLGTFKVDFGLQTSSSRAGEMIMKRLKQDLGVTP